MSITSLAGEAFAESGSVWGWTMNALSGNRNAKPARKRWKNVKGGKVRMTAENVVVSTSIELLEDTGYPEPINAAIRTIQRYCEKKAPVKYYDRMVSKVAVSLVVVNPRSVCIQCGAVFSYGPNRHWCSPDCREEWVKGGWLWECKACGAPFGAKIKTCLVCGESDIGSALSTAAELLRQSPRGPL
jgi:hypothetical protein